MRDLFKIAYARLAVLANAALLSFAFPVRGTSVWGKRRSIFEAGFCKRTVAASLGRRHCVLRPAALGQNSRGQIVCSTDAPVVTVACCVGGARRCICQSDELAQLCRGTADAVFPQLQKHYSLCSRCHNDAPFVVTHVVGPGDAAAAAFGS